ncbi:thioredoxin family protein [Rufibacter soli]
MKMLALSEIELVNPLSYDAYRALVEEAVEKNTTTGEELTPERIDFTKLNLQRMKRVEKQFALTPDLSTALLAHRPDWKWLVLVEAWCGDGAQLLPVMAGIAAEIPSIELTILLRDQNPVVMDTCLSNGARSIPKLLCFDAATGEHLFTWGARPTAIQTQLQSYKILHPDATHEQLMTQVHIWYAKDRGRAFQQDLLELVKQTAIVAQT